MSYSSALEAAGAVVHTYETFGDYQGTWVADVTFNGIRGLVVGSYGSCSGCDAFEAEIGYEHEYCREHNYLCNPPSCAACDEAKTSYDAKLAAFGLGYLPPRKATEVLEEYSDNSWYGEEGLVEFVKACVELHARL